MESSCAAGQMCMIIIVTLSTKLFIETMADLSHYMTSKLNKMDLFTRIQMLP